MRIAPPQAGQASGSTSIDASQELGPTPPGLAKRQRLRRGHRDRREPAVALGGPAAGAPRAVGIPPVVARHLSGPQKQAGCVQIRNAIAKAQGARAVVGGTAVGQVVSDLQWVSQQNGCH